MKHWVLFCIILFCFAGKNKAQNLVPNPSFELSYGCTMARLDNAIDWFSVNAGAGICAHLYTCQSDPFYTAPRQYLDNCFQSYQTIRTGNAYAEFGTYVNTPGTPESNHPACKLIDTLKAGKIYCVTYYVSHFNNARFSIDKIGALFTPTPFPYYVTGTTTPSTSIAGQYAPQIVSTPGIAYEDTLGWEEVSGTFTALGNEAYLTLGDFFLHSQHYVKNSYPTNCNTLAEYYIDDVSVEVVEVAKAKNDTLIMQGDSIVIGANNSEAALFSWQPSDGLNCTSCPNPNASPSITTTYTVTKTQCKAVTSDVITVNVSPTGINELNYNKLIKVSPNPANEYLNINVSAISDLREELKIRITDVLGREILITDYQSQLTISALEKGIYFVSVVQGGTSLVTKKIIKE